MGKRFTELGILSVKKFRQVCIPIFDLVFPRLGGNDDIAVKA